LFGAEADHDRNVGDAALGESVKLNFKNGKVVEDRDHALGFVFRVREQSFPLSRTHDDGFHGLRTPPKILFALRFDLSLVNFFVAVSPPFKLGSQSVAIALSSLDLVL
jgi:hypothetical protein